MDDGFVIVNFFWKHIDDPRHPIAYVVRRLIHAQAQFEFDIDAAAAIAAGTFDELEQ